MTGRGTAADTRIKQSCLRHSPALVVVGVTHMIDRSGDEPRVRECEGHVVVGFAGGAATVREDDERQVVAGNRRVNRDGLGEEPQIMLCRRRSGGIPNSARQWWLRTVGDLDRLETNINSRSDRTGDSEKAENGKEDHEFDRLALS
jgi:hypothetical protein